MLPAFTALGAGESPQDRWGDFHKSDQIPLRRTLHGRKLVTLYPEIREVETITLLQLFLAIAIPLEHPVYNIFLSYNIEANYNVPENQTDFTYPPIVSKRSLMQRKNFYEAIENKIEM